MKRNLILSLVAILGVIFMAQISFARQPTAGKKPMAAPKSLPDVDDPAVVKSPFKFSTAISFAYEQSAEENSNGVRSRGLGLAVVPKFVFWDFSIRADLFYGYDLNAPSTASGIADGVFSLLYDGWKFSALKFSPYTSVELPLSKESRENREIELVNNLGVLVSLDTKALDIPKLSMSYSVAYGYYTNKYTTRVNGEPATEYKIVQTFKAGYNFDPISISTKFQFTSAYSYEDIVRSGFLLVENISYAVNDTVGFSLYHYNRAALLKDTTYENNLKAFDKETSTIGLGIDLSL